MSKRVTVVGAGPGGLAASLLLAAAGCQVTLLEARGRVGGRSASHQEAGFRFDTGPTFFLYPEILESIFAAAGRNLYEEVELIPLDPMYRICFGDGTSLDATTDLARMARSVAELSTTDGEEVERFFGDNRSKFDRFKPFLQRPFLGRKALLDPDLIALLPTLAPWRRLETEVGRYFTDPRVQMAFSFQALYLGMTPQSCPSLFSIIPHIEYHYGVFHPRGGCGQVMDVMARTAAAMGVEVRLNEPVRGLRFNGRRAVGVDTEQGHYRADAVVVNADFAAAMSTLVPDGLRRRWRDRNLSRRRYSCSTFMLYLGLRGAYPERPHHTIYVPHDYRRNLEEIERGQELSADPAFYVQNASVTDLSLAPSGHSTLYVLLPVPHQTSAIDWGRQRPRYRKLAFEQLAKVGFVDAADRVCYERCITPQQWQHDYRLYRGATFNLAHNFGQMLHRRPRNRFEDLDGVYLVGGGTHPGSGLPTIFESARISVRLLCEELGLTVPFAPAPRPRPSALTRALQQAGRFARALQNEPTRQE